MVLCMYSEATVKWNHFVMLQRGISIASTLTDSIATKRLPNTDFVVRPWTTIDSN